MLTFHDLKIINYVFIIKLLMIINKVPVKRRGFDRLWNAFLNSISGIQYAIKDEISFRQELFLFGVLTVIVFFLPVTPLYKIFLVLCHLAVIVVELINSAIEEIVDYVSPQYSESGKKAKDLGSSAVFITLLGVTIVWIYTLLDVFNINLL